MIKGVAHAHLGPIWYHSDVPYSPNQFLGWDFFFAVSYSKTALAIRCASFFFELVTKYISQNSRTQPEPAIASWPEQSGDHNRTDLVRKASADFFIGGNIVS